MKILYLREYTEVAASKGKGIEFKEVLQPLLENEEQIIVDFSEISRFASPFFNNSFSALAIIYGFERIFSIELRNISKIGRDTFESSMENALLLYQNPEFQGEIEKIVNQAPKKVEC